MTMTSLTTIAPATVGAVSPLITFRPRRRRPGRPILPVEDLHEAFLAVAVRGSTNQAADAMRMSQSAVARRVQVFEDRLGVALFARQPGRPLALTAVGQAVLEKLQAMQERGGLAVPIRVLAYPKCGHTRVEAADNPHLVFIAAGAVVQETAVYVCWECFRRWGRLRTLGPGDHFIYKSAAGGGDATGR